MADFPKHLHVLFLGGDSVGHLAPSIAVLRALQKIRPDMEAHFLCSSRPDDALFLTQEKITFTVLPDLRLSLMLPLHFFRAFSRSRKLIRRFRPDVIFSKGGAVSVPPALVGKLMGIPIVLHESDSVSGRANRLVSRWARVVCKGFPGEMDNGQWTMDNTRSVSVTRETTNIFHCPLSIVHSGNPVRPDITRGSKEEGCRLTGFSGHKPVLMILGGSQGARAINEIITKSLPDLLNMCDVIHITGRGKSMTVSNTPSYWSRPFVHEELPHLYAIATLAISRAGAGFLSELAANGIPALLVPLRGVGHDHQYHNAKVAALTGGCLHVEQSDLPSMLIPTVRDVLSDSEKRKRMSMEIRKLHRADAAERIAREVLRVSGV